MYERASIVKSGVLKQQPQSKKMTHREMQERREPKEQEDEGQQVVFMEEGRRTQQEELVETEQVEESQATSPL